MSRPASQPTTVGLDARHAVRRAADDQVAVEAGVGCADRDLEKLVQRWEVTVAEADGILVGFLALALSEHRLDQLFVAPGAQGRGIGRRLVEVAKQRMPEGFWLSTRPDNRRARAFYERSGMGFDRLEPGQTGDRAVYVFPPPPPQVQERTFAGDLDVQI